MAAKRGKALYLDLYDEAKRTKETPAEMGKRMNIPAKTISNWFSRIRKGEVKREPGTGKAGTGKSKAGKPPAKPANAGAGKEKKSRPAPADTDTPGDGKEQGAHKPPRKHNKGWENLIPAGPGNQRALKHGAYAKHLAPDVVEALEEYDTAEKFRSLEGEIQLVRGRLMTVARLRAEWEARADYSELTEQDYQLQEMSVKDTPMGKERSARRVRPDFEGQEERLLGRLGHLIQVHEQLSKRVSITADQAVALRSEIMDRAAEEGWLPSATGLEIEKRGLEVPYTLQAQIRSELALAEPEEPEGGMTDDELEQLSRDYESAAEGEDRWLKERREEVERIHQDKEQEKKGE